MNIIVEVPHVFLKSSNRLLKIGLSMSVEKKTATFQESPATASRNDLISITRTARSRLSFSLARPQPHAYTEKVHKRAAHSVFDED